MRFAATDWDDAEAAENLLACVARVVARLPGRVPAPVQCLRA